MSDTVEHSFNYFGKEVSALCSKIATPVIITGLFRDLLIRQFSDPNNLRESRLRHLLWDDTNGSKILVESIHRWRPETTQKRPAIILKRNAYRNTRVTVGEQYQGAPGDTQGNTRYITLWSGTHTLFCLAGSGAEAELLSTEVQQSLTEFAPLMSSYIPRLHRMHVAEVGPVAEIEESQETSVVPVTVFYQYEQGWILKMQAPRLMNVAINLITDC
jgi:hypothetical protein